MESKFDWLNGGTGTRLFNWLKRMHWESVLELRNEYDWIKVVTVGPAFLHTKFILWLSVALVKSQAVLGKSYDPLRVSVVES